MMYCNCTMHMDFNSGLLPSEAKLENQGFLKFTCALTPHSGTWSSSTLNNVSSLHPCGWVAKYHHHQHDLHLLMFLVHLNLCITQFLLSLRSTLTWWWQLRCKFLHLTYAKASFSNSLYLAHQTQKHYRSIIGLCCLSNLLRYLSTQQEPYRVLAQSILTFLTTVQHFY